jgi:hypothetical protein
MTIPTLKPQIKCANPNCPVRFHIGEGLKYTNYCSKECARLCTPRPTKQVSQRGSFGVSVTLTPAITRKADGGTRKAKTE